MKDREYRNLEEFNGKHFGRTCFVLGSGPSLYFEDLSPLKNYITFVVNAAYLAFPKANYFVSDDWSVSRWSYFFEDLKNSETTVLLYEDKLSEYAEMFGDRAVLFRHRRGKHITDKYRHDEKKFRICESRTSLGSAIHIAHIMGCKKIVLLGVDCCRVQGRRWFWQFGNDHPVRNDKIPADRYKTIEYKKRQSDTDLVDILSAWTVQSRELKKRCNIVNASRFTSLPDFVIARLEDCFDKHTKL